MDTLVYDDVTHERYLSTARDYAKLWNVENDHVINIMTSVMLHRDGLRPGGGFVQAVVGNNLSLAVSRADATCITYLKQIVAANQSCYVE
jgi:hypothetical protein